MISIPLIVLICLSIQHAKVVVVVKGFMTTTTGDGGENSIHRRDRLVTSSSSSSSVIWSEFQNQNPQSRRTRSNNDATGMGLAASSSICFPDELIHSLDLIPLIENIAQHTTSRRGYNGLMSLVNNQPAAKQTSSSIRNNSNQRNHRRNQRMQEMMTTPSMSGSSNSIQPLLLSWENAKDKKPLVVRIAKSLEEVHIGYDLVQEATNLLLQQQQQQQQQPGDADDDYNYYPPIYDVDSNPFDSTKQNTNNNTPDTDYDEWLYLPPNQYTPEHILQAEQILKMLLKVQEWSQQSIIQTIAPNLSNIVSIAKTNNNEDHDYDNLQNVYEEIKGTMEIVRVQQSLLLTNIEGKSTTGTTTYSIRIKDDNNFPILQLLREKEDNLLKHGAKEYDKELVTIQEEIETTTQQILSGLAQRILGISCSIDYGLNSIAEIDIIMAKALYGLSLQGVFPLVENKGKIQVDKFIHPVLACRRAIEQNDIVPIDLQLSSSSSTASHDQQQALIISGGNGGGKTMAMKSFGMVSILTKLGVPIPTVTTTNTERPPRVDFFDSILVNIGDHQNVLDGESTWTSILNKCAIIIDTIEEQQQKSETDKKTSSFLVLLDEFGSAGTDPEACGAVAQAILEELLSKPSCRIVVTTHSPRLKAWSYEEATVGCAAVLLEENNALSAYKRPSFKLEYGIIGESYALGAASRTRPSLPESVISRASDLMSVREGSETSEESRTHNGYIQALTSSMEEQLQRLKVAATFAEEDAENAMKCRQAMVTLAGSYDIHLKRMVEKIDDTFKTLKSDGATGDIELVGESLSQLKAVRRKIISQQERLAQQGLRVLPLDYALIPGESVVIISDGEWQGMTAKILSVTSNSDETPLRDNEVLVKPSTASLHAWDDDNDVMLTNLNPTMTERPLILQRHELAIWDYYGGIFDEYDSFKAAPSTSISDSKRKVDTLLATINSVSKKRKTGDGSSEKDNKILSSRQRKAVNKAKRKRK